MDQRAHAHSVRLGLLYGFLAYAAWGLLSPLGKGLLDDFEPLGLNAVRFLLATAAFLACIGKDAIVASVRLLRHRGVLWVNLLANVSLTLFLYSLTRLDATYATLGFYTAPLWTAAWAMASLDEHVGRWFAPAAVGLLAGGYLALFGLDVPGKVDGLGLALAVGSAVLWAFYTVGLRRHAPDIPLRPLLGAGFLFGTTYYYVLALAFEGPPRWTGHGPEVWGWMAVYVAGPSLASFVLFNAAIQKAPAGLVNLLVGAELGFTVLFSFLLLGDRFGAWQLAGLALVLFSVTLYLWARNRRPQDLAPKPA